MAPERPARERPAPVSKQARPCDLNVPRRVSVLGATGSIGDSTTDLLERNPDAYDVIAVSAARNTAKLAERAIVLRADVAVVADPACYGELRDRLAGTGIEAAAGDSAIVEAAERPADWVMAAISGAAGLRPTWAAMRQGTTVALANKECLVTAGSLFMGHAQECAVRLMPVDSEHSAVFQCLDGSPAKSIERVTLTASGGPFRTWSRDEMQRVRPEQALKHPNWSMGAKITIDSATLMNKGLELIEALHLFALQPAQIDAVVHPQSIVHSLVQYHDGSVLAQLGVPDMRTPIAFALSCPDRIETPVKSLDLVELARLDFEAPDLDKFACLKLAQRAMAHGDAAACVLNAANEEAVPAFLGERIGFLDIATVVEDTLEAADRAGLLGRPATLDDVMQLDAAARGLARQIVDRHP